LSRLVALTGTKNCVGLLSRLMTPPETKEDFLSRVKSPPGTKSMSSTYYLRLLPLRDPSPSSLPLPHPLPSSLSLPLLAFAGTAGRRAAAQARATASPRGRGPVRPRAGAGHQAPAQAGAQRPAPARGTRGNCFKVPAGALGGQEAGKRVPGAGGGHNELPPPRASFLFFFVCDFDVESICDVNQINLICCELISCIVD